jgi:hypothetical protein
MYFVKSSGKNMPIYQMKIVIVDIILIIVYIAVKSQYE